MSRPLHKTSVDFVKALSRFWVMEVITLPILEGFCTSTGNPAEMRSRSAAPLNPAAL